MKCTIKYLKARNVWVITERGFDWRQFEYKTQAKAERALTVESMRRGAKRLEWKVKP